MYVILLHLEQKAVYEKLLLLYPYSLIIILLSSLSDLSVATRVHGVLYVPIQTIVAAVLFVTDRTDKEQLSGPSARGSRVTGFVLSDYVVIVVVVAVVAVLAVVVVIVIITVVGPEGCEGVVCVCV